MAQNITEATPRSTVIVAGVLWSVLFALMAWNLSMTVQLLRLTNNIPAHVEDLEQRVRVLERKP